jgi:hypothetical protein
MLRKNVQNIRMKMNIHILQQHVKLKNKHFSLFYQYSFIKEQIFGRFTGFTLVSFYSSHKQRNKKDTAAIPNGK